jgi:putative addiction module killer protein
MVTYMILSFVKVLEYVDVSGTSPFAGWFDELDAQAAAKITVMLARIEQGNLSNVKGVGAGVHEFRIDFGPGYRVYLGGTANTSLSCWEVVRRAASKRTLPRLKRDGWTTSGVRKRLGKMPLTREFKETVKARAERDPAFREALLVEAAEQLLAGELEGGKAVLRDYINATVGFDRLAKATGTPSKSLMRMLGPKGNPRASNLLTVIGKLQQISKIHLAVAAE